MNILDAVNFLNIWGLTEEVLPEGSEGWFTVNSCVNDATVIGGYGI